VAEGTTVLLTTQYLEEADRLADRVAVVDNGRVIAEGTPAELKAQLGNTVIEFGMGDESDASRARRCWRASEGSSPEREGTTIRVPSGDGPRALMGVLRELDMEQLFPATLAVREPSLDDVFLRLTGHHAEQVGDEGAEAEPAPVGGVRR